MDVNLNLHRVPADKKGVSLRSKVPENTRVQADREMINTVLRNLINNAVKYSHPGGAIEIRSADSNGYLEVIVQDEGTGFERENLEKVFRIDTKFKSPGTQGEKGTGLGLILCRELVEKNGGEIRVESEEGSGATFYFTIPVSKQ